MYLRCGLITSSDCGGNASKCKCLVKQGAAGIFEWKCDEIKGRSNCANIMEILIMRKA
jgi:Na+-transporting NADH:ubiquinone oxidoreductase subunit NqrF